MAPRQCGIRYKPELRAKSFLYIVFGTLATYVCLYMHAQVVSMRTHMCVCMHKIRVSCGLFLFLFFFIPKIVLFFQKYVIFSRNTFLKSIFTRLGPKLTLSFRALPLLGNESSSRKGYKMRCLQAHSNLFILRKILISTFTNH